MQATENSIKVTGHIKAELIRDGKVVQVIETPNVVTDGGKSALASYLATPTIPTTNFIMSMGFGTGAGAAAGTNTSITELTSATHGAGYTTRPTIASRTASTTKVTYVSSVTNVTATVAEVGLFNAASGGTLIARQVLSGAIALVPADTLQITWELSFS